VEPPRPLGPADRATGALSVALGMNVNPSLRRILADSRQGAAPLPAYPSSLTEAQATEAATSTLSQGGLGGDAAKAAPEIAKLAKAIDADPAALGRAIARDVSAVRQAAAAISPQSPILVDGARDPASVGRATESMSALMSQATPKAEGWRRVTLEDGSQVDLFFEPEVAQTRVMSDIDGVVGPSYTVRAFDVAVTLPDGRTGHVFLKMDQPPGGEITSVHGLTYQPGSSTAQVEADVKSGETGRTERRRIDVPVSQEQAEILAQAQSTAPTSVEGLGARYFPPSSLAFLKLASKNAEGGNRTLGAVDLPEVVLNTFGTALDPTNPKAFRGSPAQLITSIARSLGFDETVEPVPDGFYAIPGIKVYSGGSAITQGSRLSEPFGLSPEQAQGFQNVAKSIRPLIDEFSDSWGLSPAAQKAWQDAVFANPDIPSVILSGSVVEELKHRTQASHPLRTLADLQRQLDERLNTVVEQNGLERVITLHHTPTGSSPGKPDDVAYHDPAQPSAPFTTEWQFAVNGQKALPVLDDVIAKLERDHGFDLKAALEAQGYSYGRIREMSLEQTIALFRDVIRPMIAARGPNLLGNVVIGVDTYAEKNGRPGGSDASMIRAAEALYGAPNVTVVQVDTFSGKPGEPGRNPAFSMGLNGRNRLEVTNPSVDPDGPNGAIAPSFYVTRPEEFGRVMNGALSQQSPLTPEEWRVRNRNGEAAPGGR
jgi:hypothetical protein